MGEGNKLWEELRCLELTKQPKNMVASWISNVTTFPLSVPGYFEGACAELTLECHSTAHWGATQWPYRESNPVSLFMDTYWGQMVGYRKKSPY